MSLARDLRLWLLVRVLLLGVMLGWSLSFIPARGRCKGTQQPEDVAYIPTTPLGVQGPATAGGGVNREKGCK